MRGDRRVSERESASASLGPDPQASVPLLLGLTGPQCLPRAEGGRCWQAVRAPFHVFSLLTQTQAAVSVLAEQEVCFSAPVDGVIACVLSCVSWIPPFPLVELYHWLQGEGTGGADDLEVTFRERASQTCCPAALTQVLVSYRRRAISAICGGENDTAV